jgi:hypothetical protein
MGDIDLAPWTGSPGDPIRTERRPDMIPLNGS